MNLIVKSKILIKVKRKCSVKKKKLYKIEIEGIAYELTKVNFFCTFFRKGNFFHCEPKFLTIGGRYMYFTVILVIYKKLEK